MNVNPSTFFKGKKVLVAGGSGFVGSHFVLQLLEQGAQVRVPTHVRAMEVQDPRIEIVQGDLTNPDDCLRVLEDIEIVVNASGAVSAAGVDQIRHLEIIARNLITSVRLIQAAWIAGVERFLMVSSHTTYPAADYPIKEEEAWSGPPHPAYFSYSWMRRYVEKLGEFVHEKSKTKIAIVRPTAVYGEYDNFEPVSCHVVPALIVKAVSRMNPYQVWGTGDEVRDFAHVSDLVRGSLLVLEKHAVCDPINIGYGATVTIKDVVREVLKAADYCDAPIVFDASKPTTIPFRMVDTSKAKRLFGFEPSVTLADGLKRTVDWYKRELAKGRKWKGH
jgi:GDP-L-fucose synthase